MPIPIDKIKEDIITAEDEEDLIKKANQIKMFYEFMKSIMPSVDTFLDIVDKFEVKPNG